MFLQYSCAVNHPGCPLQEDIVKLFNITAAKRQEEWRQRRMLFCTPQVSSSCACRNLLAAAADVVYAVLLQM
jgi:ERCC4-related helicase